MNIALLVLMKFWAGATGAAAAGAIIETVGVAVINMTDTADAIVNMTDTSDADIHRPNA